jgi:hypothetical protein
VIWLFGKAKKPTSQEKSAFLCSVGVQIVLHHSHGFIVKTNAFCFQKGCFKIAFELA